MTRIAVAMLLLFTFHAHAQVRTRVSPETRPVGHLDLTTLTTLSDIVVYGEVESTESVWRQRLVSHRTTDVTIRINQLLKGEPNLGDDRVVFMIIGGRGLEVSHQPTFEVGEMVLLFIYKDTNPKTPENRRYPYGGLSVGSKLRKRKVEDNQVSIPYTTYKAVNAANGTRIVEDFDKPIHLPRDLVQKMVKAVILDSKRVLSAEEKIRVFAKDAQWIGAGKHEPLDNDMLDKLIAEMDNILLTKEENDVDD